MSQYAFIPIEKAGDLKQDYSIATPQTWQFDKGDARFGGLEDEIFSDEQKAEIQANGGQWFESANAFLKWQYS